MFQKEVIKKLQTSLFKTEFLNFNNKKLIDKGKLIISQRSTLDFLIKSFGFLFM